MEKFLEITALILLPLAWGLAVEWFFRRLRRSKPSSADSPEMAPNAAKGDE
jgi:hypothetical protein